MLICLFDCLFSVVLFVLRFSLACLQEPIPGHTRTQILSELKDLRDVSDVISTLEIVIAFLSSAGGNPEVKLSEYCNDVLQLSNGKASLKSKKVGILEMLLLIVR